MHLHRLMFYLPGVSFVRNLGKNVGAGVSLVTGELGSSEMQSKMQEIILMIEICLQSLGLLIFTPLWISVMKYAGQST